MIKRGGTVSIVVAYRVPLPHPPLWTKVMGRLTPPGATMRQVKPHKAPGDPDEVRAYHKM
jgi:hypothetical protein